MKRKDVDKSIQLTYKYEIKNTKVINGEIYLKIVGTNKGELGTYKWIKLNTVVSYSKEVEG